MMIAEKKPALQKSHFCFDHVNRLSVYAYSGTASFTCSCFLCFICLQKEF